LVGFSSKYDIWRKQHMSEYYTKHDLYGDKFYQLPKVFMTNPLYKKGLTDTEKIAFALLKDRFSLSQKNEWFDEKGRIYFIFSQVELMALFDCSNKTASNIKTKLIKVGLLEKKSWGQGKADWLYLKKPIVTDNDIYKINEAESLGAVKTCKNDTSRNVKNTRLEVQNIHANNTDLKNTELNNTDNKSLLTKNDLINICNSFYSTYSVGRWSKKQWTTLIEKYVSETDWQEVAFPKSFIEGSIKGMARHFDYREGKIEYPFDKNGIDYLDSEGKVPFYNWLEE
jgi:replication initiator protein